MSGETRKPQSLSRERARRADPRFRDAARRIVGSLPGGPGQQAARLQLLREAGLREAP